MPVNDEKEAENAVKTAKVVQLNPAQVEISVESSAGTQSWVFAKEKEGLVLKR